MGKAVSGNISQSSHEVAAPSVRYAVYIPVSVPGDDCDDYALQFVVKGFALPRVGETLGFDSVGGGLRVVVSEVVHTFFTQEDGPPFGDVVVTADLGDGSPVQNARALQLLDMNALNKWISEFPMLEPMFPV
ncbi:hypothetical protein [Nocardia sp. NPDC004711]